MSEYLPVATTGLFPTRLDRQVAKSRRLIDAQAAVARHADQAQIDRITTTTQYGMSAAAHLVVVEASLAGIAPEAQPELRAIRIGGTIGIASVVHRAGLGL